MTREEHIAAQISLIRARIREHHPSPLCNKLVRDLRQLRIDQGQLRLKKAEKKKEKSR